jgi:hypothetical protein
MITAATTKNWYVQAAVVQAYNNPFLLGCLQSQRIIAGTVAMATGTAVHMALARTSHTRQADAAAAEPADC